MNRPALLLWAALPAAACPLPPTALQKGDVQAVWQVDGAPIVVGRHFSLAVQVCPVDATLARVDATMPEHRHGMNYRPSLKRLPDGRWRAEGLMFHMPGRWDLQLEVKVAGRTEKLVDTITQP
jgi:hypothetical protein